jgi:hypothetical protein
MNGSSTVSKATPFRGGVLPLTGATDLPLERAVLAFETPEDHHLPGGRSEDLGLGVVLESNGGGLATVWDAGSGAQRTARTDLPLIIFGWVYRSSLAGLRADPTPHALELLERIGYGAASRPVFLRAAFRDIAQDLDPHEGTAVRLSLAGGGVIRAHIDYGHGQMVVQTARAEADPKLRLSLSEAFPGWPLHFVSGWRHPGSGAWLVQIPALPDLTALRREMGQLRSGLLRLMARHDSARYRAVCDALRGFGERDLLARVSQHPGTSQGRHEQERVH